MGITNDARVVDGAEIFIGFQPPSQRINYD